MESYQTWFGEGPELAVLRMLGLFDRPADEKALEALAVPPVISGLTESLTQLSSIERRTILAKLRRARLLAPEDPHSPGQVDTHPLVREYFGEQLRSQQTEAWKECNRRLYSYYRALAPQLPDNFREMEPLFLAVICGCNADLFRDSLHEVYIPRIQRGDASTWRVVPPMPLRRLGRRRYWSKGLKGAGCLPNCAGFAVCFWRLLLATKPKFKLHSARQSTPQRSRSRFR
jgi:hypothetical protein